MTVARSHRMRAGAVLAVILMALLAGPLWSISPLALPFAVVALLFVLLLWWWMSRGGADAPVPESPRPTWRGHDWSVRRFIQRTWLPTVVFVPLLTAYAAWDVNQCDPIKRISIPVSGLLLVPAIWWWILAQGEGRHFTRGAAAGAMCVVLAVNFAPILRTIWLERSHPSLDGMNLGRLELAVTLMMSVSVGGSIGALVGGFVAALQNRWWRAPAERTLAADNADRRRTAGDGAIAGAVVAALAGLIGCVFLSLEWSYDSFLDVLMGIGALWLILIPPGAVLGATAVVVRRRFAAVRGGLSSSRA